MPIPKIFQLIIADSFIVGGDRVMVFNATFDNISVISWQSVLLMDETGVLREYP
jgi:hypothetical protein